MKKHKRSFKDTLISIEGLDSDRLTAEINKILPNGVELLRAFKYRVPLENNSFDFLVLRAVVPEAKELALSKWKEEFEDEYETLVFVDRWGHRSAIKKEVKRWAAGARLITKKHINTVLATVNSFYGREPKLSKNIEYPELEDLTHIPLIAIDSEGTTDREDAVWAEEVESKIKLTVAIIDVTWFVTPGNEFDRYAERVGETVYGTNLSVPTLGREVARTLASFNLNERRPSWFMTFVIDPEGTFEVENFKRGIGICTNHIDPKKVDLVSQRDTPVGKAVRALALGCSRLRSIRLKSKHIIRMEGDGLGELIVSESMISFKKALAKELIKTKRPAIFRVHSAPTKEVMMRLAEKVVAVGIPATEDNFKDPLQLASILRGLEHRRAWSLLHRVLRAFLIASSFSDINTGHYGIGISAEEGEGYIDVKPRDASGIANQFQLKSIVDPSFEALTQEEIAFRAEHRERQRRHIAFSRYRLRFAERVSERLQLVGETFKGKVQRQKGDKFLVAVTGFSKWGVVRSLISSPPLGVEVQLKLLGFSVKDMRFRFKWLG